MREIRFGMVVALLKNTGGGVFQHRLFLPQKQRELKQPIIGCHHIDVLCQYQRFAEAIKKFFGTEPHCFIVVVKPKGSGEKYLVSQLLKNLS